MSYQWVRASEIADYVYCRRAWWLRRARGIEPLNQAQLRAGTQHHVRHGQLVQRSVWAMRLAYVVLFLAVAVLAFELLSG